MQIPNVEVWALPKTGSAVCLADLGDYEISRVLGEAGTVRLNYPAGGAGWDLLAKLQDPYERLRVEIRTDGTSATARQAILTDAKGDPTKPSAPWEITGLGLGLRLTHAVTPYSDDGENGDTAIQGTPGVIMRTLLARAQARDVLTDLDFSSFTNTTDSRGATWALEAALTYSPGRDYLSIVAEMHAKLGLCDWDVRRGTSGDELRLYNLDTIGVDRAVPGQQVCLEWGRDFGDGPVTSSNRDVGTDVLGVGVNGMYVTATNTAARASLGEKIEIYKDFGSVYEDATLTALTAAAAEQAGVGARSFSHELILGDTSPTPGVDYDVGDWVLRAISGTTERVRVSQLVLRRQDGVVSASVTLGDLLAEQEVKTRRMLESIQDGSAIVGTSTARPDVDDGKVPAAPAKPTVTSTAYYDGTTPVCSVTAGWTAVTLNTDGTALDDMQGYEVSYSWQSGQGLPTDWQVAGATAGTSLSWGPLPQNKILQVRVRALDKWQHYSAPSESQIITTAADADAPPVPSTPAGRSYLGLTVWEFDGKGSSGQAMPDDFSHVELHMSTVGPLFAVDRPLRSDGSLDAAASTTYRDRLTGPGEMPISPGGSYGVTWYGRWVSVDRTGNASAPSTAGSATLAQAADGDVAELNVGKLRTGILSALMTISGIIRTATSGARVELDTTGLRCYDSAGTVLLEFHIPTSVLTLVGRLKTGKATESRVELGTDTWGRGNITTFDAAAPNPSAVIGQIYNATSGAPVASGVIVQKTDSGNQDLFHAFGNATDPAYASGVRVIRAEDNVTALQVVEGSDNYVALRDTGNTSTAYAGPLSQGGQGLSVDDSGANVFAAGRQWLSYQGRQVSGRFGRMYCDTPGDQAFLGIAGTSTRSGFDYFYNGTVGITTVRSSGYTQITNSSAAAFGEIRASAFTVSSAAETKDGFEALPAPALSVLRAAPAARWRYTGDKPGAASHVGPVADDLPAWAKVPPDPEPAAGPDGEPGPPNAERVDLASMIGLLWSAVRELDAELDVLRAQSGVPAPVRRSVADLLSDVRAGRIGRRR